MNGSGETNGVEILSRYIDPEKTPIDYQVEILRYWNEKRGERFAPRWDEFSLYELPPRAIPLINVTDIVPKPLKSTYRFWGSGLTEVFGGDYTGKGPQDVPPKTRGINMKGGCARLVRDRVPNFEIKDFETEKGLFGRALILRVIFSDDGETVNKGLNSYFFESLTGRSKLTDFYETVFSKVG
ncbi:MAG: hypothetical protein CMM60_13515 [Rhodospirillaceae bacterium]|jgi:hypothetical protein|nr:hypothetical protein [Rhodospirillaceae bacterium]|tara:strand:- start:2222 stop:2770 length:549 start_codon:yes stop_codon:yes gene_type:complete